MKRTSKFTLLTVALITLGAVIMWQATGGDWYTKFQVVEQVETVPESDDPLAAAGFYDGERTTETVTRDEFHFGLLPTPSGIFDKHALSVASVTAPVWIIGLGIVWIDRRRNRAESRSQAE